MKKIIFAFAVLLSMAACKQNKPTQDIYDNSAIYPIQPHPPYGVISILSIHKTHKETLK